MKRKIRLILRVLLWLVVVPAAAACIALSVYNVRLPQSLTDYVCDRLPSEAMLVRCNYISFGFRRGLVVNGARAYLRDKATAAPVVSADEIDASLALHRFPWRTERLVRRLKVKGLRYLRIPDGYYIPDSVEFPGMPDYMEKDEPLQISLPNLNPFKLELVEPDILGIRPSRIEVSSLSSGKNGIQARGITIDWPDSDTPMRISGETEIDLVAQTATGRVAGKVRQWHIRPFIETMDVPIAVHYIDSFTEVHEPVDAAYSFSVNLRNNDFTMLIDLETKPGRYLGVPYSSARGKIEIEAGVRGTNFNSRVTVGPVVASFVPEGHAEGTFAITVSNGVTRVAIDANSSRLSMSNLVAIADAYSDDELEDLQMHTPPLLNLQGDVVLGGQDVADSDLRGAFSFERGSMFGIEVRNVQAQFRKRGAIVDYPHMTGSLKSGGRLNATARITLPEGDGPGTSFTADINGTGLALGDLCEAFSIDSGDRKGTVECSASLSGLLHTNVAHSLNGTCRFNCHDGQLSRTRLFMGFTDVIAETVPGISSVVDMTQSSANLTITNGVISTKDLVVEGNIFAIKASGSYDIAANSLEAYARAQMFKQDSVIGLLTQPITSALMKMLLEFRVYGPIEDPKWAYSTPVTRLGGGK